MKGGIVMKIIMVPKIGMPLTGHFDAIRTNGEPYAIGGSVRGLLYNRPVSDYDFTIVGGDKYKTVFRTAGSHRVEIDDTAVENKSLEDYFSSRDFTLNQIAVDRFGNLYMTEAAMEDIRSGVLRPVNPEALTIREGARAIRFSQEFHLTPVDSLRAFCKEHRKEIKHEGVWFRYLREKKITTNMWWWSSNR